MSPRPLLLFLAAAATPAGATATPGPEPAPACRMSEEPAAFPELRANQIADCSYDLAGLYRRFTSLLLIPSHRVRLDAVERAFGVGPLNARFPSRRVAAYDVLLRGSDGGRTWTATLSFGERFDPVGEEHVRRFRDTPRAELIDPRHRGHIRISFRLLLPRDPAPRTPACFDVAAFGRLARSLGWRTEEQHVMVFDAPGYIELRMRRGRITASTPLHPEGGCLREFELTRNADPSAT